MRSTVLALLFLCGCGHGVSARANALEASSAPVLLSVTARPLPITYHDGVPWVCCYPYGADDAHCKSAFARTTCDDYYERITQ